MKTVSDVIKKIMFGSVIAVLAITSSCKKDSPAAPDSMLNDQAIVQLEEEHASMDNAIGESFMSFEGSQAARGSGENSIANDERRELRCAHVDFNRATSSITITFNHCEGRNGHVRNGQIIIHYQNGGYWTPGASWDETFNNYSVDNVMVTGSRHVENRGPSGIGMTWHIVSNLTFTRPDNTVRTWTSTRDRVLKEGFDPMFPFLHFFDAMFVINGTASYTDSKTGAIVGITINNITRELSCRFITSGTLIIAPKGGSNSTVNFGDGKCDDIATVISSSGSISVIHLRHRFDRDNDN